MFKRSTVKVLQQRMKEPGRFIQVIMGPRQVGKTTIVTQVLASLNISYTFESADAVPASNSLWQDC